MFGSPQSNEHVPNVSSIIDGKADSKNQANRSGDLDVEPPVMHRASDVNEGESDAGKHPQTHSHVSDEYECDCEHRAQCQAQVPQQFTADDLDSIKYFCKQKGCKERLPFVFINLSIKKWGNYPVGLPGDVRQGISTERPFSRDTGGEIDGSLNVKYCIHGIFLVRTQRQRHMLELHLAILELRIAFDEKGK